MTPALIAIVQPIETAFVTFCAAGIAAAVGAITLWAQRHFAIANTAAAKSMEANANAVIQAAVQNGAGTLIGKINAGTLDLTDPASVRAEATEIAHDVAAKVPDAVALLGAATNTLADMVVQKAALARANATAPPPPPVPAASPVIVLGKQ